MDSSPASRRSSHVLTSARVACVAVALVAVWSVSVPAIAANDLEDLLWDLQIVPLDDSAPPFTLEALDGRRRSLAEFRGRPVMLYFWESG